MAAAVVVSVLAVRVSVAEVSVVAPGAVVVSV